MLQVKTFEPPQDRSKLVTSLIKNSRELESRHRQLMHNSNPKRISYGNFHTSLPHFISEDSDYQQFSIINLSQPGSNKNSLPQVQLSSLKIDQSPKPQNRPKTHSIRKRRIRSQGLSIDENSNAGIELKDSAIFEGQPSPYTQAKTKIVRVEDIFSSAQPLRSRPQTNSSTFRSRYGMPPTVKIGSTVQDQAKSFKIFMRNFQSERDRTRPVTRAQRPMVYIRNVEYEETMPRKFRQASSEPIWQYQGASNSCIRGATALWD